MAAITEQEEARYRNLYERAQSFLPRPKPVEQKDFNAEVPITVEVDNSSLGVKEERRLFMVCATGPRTVEVDKSSLRPRWEWQLLRVCRALSRQLVLPPEARRSFIGACFSTAVENTFVVDGIPGDASHLLAPVRGKFPRLFGDPRSIEARQAVLAGRRIGTYLAQEGFSGGAFHNGLRQYHYDLEAAQRSARSAQAEGSMIVGALISLPRLAAAVSQSR